MSTKGGRGVGAKPLSSKKGIFFLESEGGYLKFLISKPNICVYEETFRNLTNVLQNNKEK